MQSGPGINRMPASEFDPMRPHSSGNLQSFYQNQRFGPRSDTDQAMQAKRRMAAQRERELRNYHQEQQYQKHLSASKSDRSMSPSTAMSEDDRRDLIARQHRALYGGESSGYSNDAATSRPLSQDARVTGPLSAGGFRGNSPLAYDPFASQPAGQTGGDSAVTMPSREGKEAAGTQDGRPNNTASPSSNGKTGFSLFENPQQQSSRTSNSSPGGSPPGTQKPSTTSAGNVAPIGTRPAGSQSTAPQPGNLQKRSTTPLPSPLSFGYSAEQQQQLQGEKPPTSQEEKQGNLKGGWGNGVWGSKGSLGVSAKLPNL